MRQQRHLLGQMEGGEDGARWLVLSEVLAQSEVRRAKVPYCSGSGLLPKSRGTHSCSGCYVRALKLLSSGLTSLCHKCPCCWP